MNMPRFTAEAAIETQGHYRLATIWNNHSSAHVILAQPIPGCPRTPGKHCCVPDDNCHSRFSEQVCTVDPISHAIDCDETGKCCIPPSHPRCTTKTACCGPGLNPFAVCCPPGLMPGCVQVP